MGLDIYLNWEGMTESDKEKQYTGSATTGINGYLRSAYNEGGPNSWARKHLGENSDLYYIFQPTEENNDDGFMPDWDECEKRRIGVVEKIKLFMLSTSLGVETISTPIDVFDSEKDFLEHVVKEFDSKNVSFDAYSSRTGTYWKNGYNIKAIGLVKSYGYNRVAIITDANEDHKWYLNFFDKEVRDFITLGKNKKGRISWSG